MSKPAQNLPVDVSWSALLKVVALVAGLYLASRLRDILVMLFVVFIFVAAANPSVVALQGPRVSRALAATILYAALLGAVALIVLLVVPALVGQLHALVVEIPAISERLRHISNGRYSGWVATASASLAATLNGLPAQLVRTTYNLFGSLAITVSGIVLSFYLLLEEKNAREFFHQILPQNRFHAVYLTVSKISARMGQWVRSELLLMLIIGLSSLILYAVFEVPSPLALGLWTGLCEAVPVVGPLLGIVPAFLVALSALSPLKAALLLVVYFAAIQQLETHVVVPRIMSKALGLSPVLVIVALLVGERLFGLVGVLVAVPTAAAISVIAGEWPNLRQIWEGEGNAQA